MINAMMCVHRDDVAVLDLSRSGRKCITWYGDHFNHVYTRVIVYINAWEGAYACGMHHQGSGQHMRLMRLLFRRVNDSRGVVLRQSAIA